MKNFKENIDQIQSNLLSLISKKTEDIPKQKINNTEFLNLLKTTKPNKFIESNFLNNIINLNYIIDWDHPLTIAMFNELCKQTQVIGFCEEIIQLSQNVNKHIPLIQNYLNSYVDSLFKEINLTNYSKFISSPFISCILDKNLRENIRLNQKLVKNACLPSQEINKENNFNNYHRFSKIHEEEINQCLNSEKVANQYNLPGITNSLNNYKTKLIKSQEKTHYSFRIISHKQCIYILQRLMGLTENNNYYPKNYFTEKNTFWFKPSDIVDSLSKRDKEHALFQLKSGEIKVWSFSARCYRLHELINTTINENTKNILHLCDNHPDTNGKPIFDNYHVLVPTIYYPSNMFLCNNFWMTKTDKGIQYHEDSNDCLKTIDTFLIRTGSLLPIILGEFNGEYYFISYYK